MAQPTPYSVSFSFSTYAVLNPLAPFNATALDNQLAAIETTTDGILQNLALIQRDDGALANGIVTPDSLSNATFNLMGSWRPRGTWAALTNYAVLDVVTPPASTITYVCNTAHTSSAAFVTDYALGYWQPINGVGIGGVLVAANISFTQTDVILGRSSSGAGAGQEIACTAFARSLLDDATAADARTTLGVGSGSSPTFVNVTAASLTLSLLTASSFVYADANKAIASTAAPTNGQLLIGSTGSVPVAAALAGTAHQVTVTNGAGSITLSLPQDIDTASAPTFSGVQLTDLASGSVVFVGGSSALSEDNSNFVWNNITKCLGVQMNAPIFPVDVGGTGYVHVLNGIAFAYNPTYDTYDANILKRSAFAGVAGSLDGTDLWGWYAGGFVINGSGGLRFSDAGAFSGATVVDAGIYRDGANVLAQRNGVNPQEFRVYNTYATAGTDFERLSIEWASNEVRILSEAGGTGIPRAMVIGANISNITITTDTTGDIILAPGGDIRINKALVALGGGSLATMGTIGGSGPATQAQNTWMRVLDSTGAACWIPVWK